MQQLTIQFRGYPQTIANYHEISSTMQSLASKQPDLSPKPSKQLELLALPREGTNEKIRPRTWNNQKDLSRYTLEN